MNYAEDCDYADDVSVTRADVIEAAEHEPEIVAALEKCDAMWPNGAEHRLTAFYEHGQWWVTILAAGCTWSVHEHVDIHDEEGLCFELVSSGEIEL